jgi:murein DD-endopeptidase MepM/ murein hydrolase activator NlpD
MTGLQTIFSSTIIGISLIFTTASQAIGLPDAEAVPGGIVLLELPVGSDGAQATFNSKPVLLAPTGDTYTAVVGLPLTTKPGKHTLTLKTADGKQTTLDFQVSDKQYETQHITIKNKRQVSPEKRDMVRIRREQQRIRKALANWDRQRPDSLRFLTPIDGPVSSPFGLRRFFNEQPRKPHSGLDLAAAEGAPIRAPAGGRISDTGDFFFNGNTVFVDHGQGLVTMYCHLSRIDVKPGQQVQAGEIIGAVGQTGRVTGPHLHWSVSLNDARVDPMLFLDQPPPTKAAKSPPQQ